MNPRTTGILFLVALALGAFIYFYEIGGEEGRREAKERERQLFPGVEESDIAWIELRTKDGAQARFEREKGAWKLVKPLEFPADAAVERMATTLASVTSESVFEEHQPRKEYGLDDDSATTVRFGSGDETHELRLGRNTPVGSDRYAATDASDAVYTVASYQAAGFDKSLSDFRDKRVVEFDRSAIRDVEVRWPDARVVAHRNEDGHDGVWVLRAPLETRADDAALDGLLSSLEYLRADGFVDDPSEEQRAQLDPPDFEVVLGSEGDASAPIAIAIGRANADGKRLVRTGRSTLYQIPAERIDDFPREVVAYRYRTLSSFPVTEAQQIDFFFQPPAGDPVAITAVRGEEGWTSEPEDFAPGKLPRVASELSRLVAKDILGEKMGEAELEKLGLSPPTTIVSVFGQRPAAQEGQEADSEAEGSAGAPLLAEIQLGRVTADGVVARAAGNPTVYRLDRKFAEHVPVDLATFQSTFKSKEPAAPETPADGAPAGSADELPSPRAESP